MSSQEKEKDSRRVKDEKEEEEEEGKVSSATTGLAALDLSDDASGAVEIDKNGNGKGQGQAEDDEQDLFKPPSKEDCSICFVPLPIDAAQIGYHACCGKRVCFGCDVKEDAIRRWSNAKREAKNPPLSPLEEKCAFCREAVTKSEQMRRSRIEKRMSANDAVAFHLMGNAYDQGTRGLPRDKRKAVELTLRAVELGSADACIDIAKEYQEGDVLECDQSKIMYYLKLAAKRGNVRARVVLGIAEFEQGNIELAIKHLMIGAAGGDDLSLKKIGAAYRKKDATKGQYEEALRAYQKAKEEVSSDERDMAKKFFDCGHYWSVFSETELAKLSGVRENERALFSCWYAAVIMRGKG